MLSCESVLRRLQAVVVVLALLIAPLALYAHGAADAMRDCDGMCCLPHAHAMSMAVQMAKPAAEPQQPGESTASTEPECHHDASAKTTVHSRTATAKAPLAHSSAVATHNASASNASAMQCALDCAAHRAPHSGNFGLLVPIAPTKPSHIAAIRMTIDSERFAHSASQVTTSDFLGSPFQPPRA